MVILPSILDNDFYKFTMQQCVVKLFPKAKARYRFINRGHHSFPAGFAAALKASIDSMAELCLTKKEKEWLATTCPYLDPVYLDFLQGYRYDPDEIRVEQNGDEVKVFIEGYWYRTILWEVPVLCLISENFYRFQNQERETDEAVIKKTKSKIQAYGAMGITIAEFGTRRRHSFNVQDLVVQT
jgi:nicotinate phosphoribosyltransferase